MNANTSRRLARRPRFDHLETRQVLSTALALTDQNQLLQFETSSPGTIDRSVAVTGLQAGESLLGIDIRPADGRLYGLGSTSRLYRIDALTGAATQVGTGTFAIPLSGTDFGFDFNPTVDRIRVVSNTRQDLRLNPDTGAVVDGNPNSEGIQPDGQLTYAANDVNAAATPQVTGAAYINNVAGATTTTLFDIDTNLDVLVTQNPPNAGTLNTVGPLGVNASALNGFDVSPTGTAYAAMIVGASTTSPPGLYTINLTTGAASPLGGIGTSAVNLRGLTIAPSVQFAARTIVVDESVGLATITVTRTEGTTGAVSVNYATVPGTALEGVDYTAVSGTLTFAAGESVATFTVPILNDTALEGTEDLGLILTGITGNAVIGGPATSILRIAPNDTPAGFGPQVVGARIVGNVEAVTGVVVRFSQPMDPNTVGLPRNYGVFAGPPRFATRVPLFQLNYQADTQTMRLTFASPLSLSQARRLTVNLRGLGNRALVNESGTRLNATTDSPDGGNVALVFRRVRTSI